MKKLQELYEEFILIIGDKYVGERLNGKKHGLGKYTWFDGCKYEGYYRNDLREGYGKVDWAEGDKYEGYWVENLREGFGKYFYQNKNFYEGEFKKDEENGFGIFTQNDGHQYHGDFKEDYFEGIGIINYNDGSEYRGEFIKGRRNGIGTYYYKDGRKFEGEWKNNKKNGKGIFYLNNEKKYEGYWEENRRILDNYIENEEYIKKKEIIGNKQIRIEYVDGDIYQGEYNPETKIIEGSGKYIFNSGNTIYEGNFENNLFNGEGSASGDGKIIIGMFKNGKLNGQVKIIYDNGNTLKDEFKDGKKEGVFLSYDKSKNITKRVMYHNDYFDNKFIDF